MTDVEKAYRNWVDAMKYSSKTKIFDAKQDLIQVVRGEYQDPDIRTKMFDLLLDAAVEELDKHEEALRDSSL